MNFVDDGPALQLVSVAAFTTLVLVLTILLGSLHKKTKKQTYILIGSSVGLGALATILFIILGNTPVSSKVYPADIESLYGFNVSEQNLEELNFPRTNPGAEPRFYGTTALVDQDGTNAQVTEVLLGWDGEQFLLYSVGDEQTATPLPFKE